MQKESIRIEKLHQTEHFYACEDVQKQVWGMADISVVPAHLLITAQKNGGLVLGAFNAVGEMVGFLFGFLGTREPDREGEGTARRLKHCSHMTGIVPQYQGKGIGYLLKLRQREHSLSQGLDLATWTYDPLESQNANLNVCKLGVVCRTYLRDIYGEMTSAAHVGVASDRLEIEWWVASQRVAERIRKGGEKLNLDEVLEKGGKQINTTTAGPDGLLRPTECDLSDTADTILVEIPASFQSIKPLDMSLASDWRAHTGEIFEHYFASGYVVAEFITELRQGSRHSYYVLKRDFVVS